MTRMMVHLQLMKIGTDIIVCCVYKNCHQLSKLAHPVSCSSHLYRVFDEGWVFRMTKHRAHERELEYKISLLYTQKSYRKDVYN